MPKLVKYAVVGGCSLDKAVCEICQKAYGSIEAARACERTHYDAMLRGIQEAIIAEAFNKAGKYECRKIQ